MHDIFFFTDIHGMYNLYRAIMNYCQERDPEATIIYGGDACDRGSDGYKIMKELLNNPRIIYLKGNHEDMFVKAAREIKSLHLFTKDITREKVRNGLWEAFYFGRNVDNITLALGNGGISTLIDWVMDGMDMEFVECIEKLRLTCSIGKFDFCHAAGNPNIYVGLCEPEFYKERKATEIEKAFLLWDRSNFHLGWTPNRTVLFGHTSIIHLNKYMDTDWSEGDIPKPYKWTSDYVPELTGTKIDVDTGAHFTGIAYVIDVLKMQAQRFKDTAITNKENHNHLIEKIDMIQL